MTLSVGINEARKVAENIDKNLNGYDLCYTALINHEDGSFHVVKNAIVFQWNDYYLVFAEHAKSEVYHKEDASVFQLNETKIDKITDGLPYVRNLLIDDLETFLAYQFARKPEKEQILWIKDLDHKFHGRTIKIVSADEYEKTGLRQKLNLGHTFAHAIETVSGYKGVLHGEAVSIGIVLACRLSMLLGKFSKTEYNLVCSLILGFGLPVGIQKKALIDSYIAIMLRDKKTVSGVVKFVIPEKIGVVLTGVEVDKKTIKEVLK